MSVASRIHPTLAERNKTMTVRESHTIEDDKPFSFPEISLWLDEHQYILASDLITSAATLMGDGAGNDLDNNPEYNRGMAELILRFMGWSSEHLDEVMSCIKAIAVETNERRWTDTPKQEA